MEMGDSRTHRNESCHTAWGEAAPRVSPLRVSQCTCFANGTSHCPLLAQTLSLDWILSFKKERTEEKSPFPVTRQPCCEGLLCTCTFNSTPGLYPPEAVAPLSPSCDNPRHLQTLPSIPVGQPDWLSVALRQMFSDIRGTWFHSTPEALGISQAERQA